MNFTEAIVLAVEKVKAWIQSGGVKWDHVSDKPFVKVGGDTLTWDGNTAGLDNLLKFGVPYYKVSDTVFSASDVAEGFSLALNDGSRADFAPGESVGDFEGFGVALSDYIVSFNEADAATLGIAAGTYFISGGAIYPASLTIPGYTGFAKEQIDPKVLPESLQFGKTTVQGDTLEWDGNTEGLVSVAEYGLYKISDATPTFTDLNKGGVLHFVGEATPMAWNEGELAEEDVVTPQGVVVMLALYIVPAEMAGVTDETLEMTFPEAGIYTAPMATQLQLNGYSGFTKTEIKPIKPEYLPGAVVLYADESSYLYATEDISDTSKRITKAELQETLYSGRAMYLNANGMFFPAALVAFSDTYGMFSVFDGESNTVFYTAEYTA